MDSIEEQTILITGATDGLGEQVARELAGKGATVLLHGRDGGRAEAAAQKTAEETSNDKPSYYLAEECE